jgi:V8-like Glu-specific endopeptidase
MGVRGKRGTPMGERGSGGGRAAIAAVALACAGAAAIPAASAASPRGAAAVVRAVDSVPRVRAYWTPRRMRRARPLSPLALAGSPETAAGAPSGGGVTTLSAIDAGVSTSFPNSANGVVYGTYRSGRFAEDYQCSGSSVDTDAGDVVLTAGHCVIDPDTGTRATNLIFVPGYRSGSEPFGEWAASSFATTSTWEATAGGRNPDEAGDVAMLTIEDRPSDGASLRSVVGALGIAFNRARDQTYTQYGYPAESPYDGSRLYENTARYAFGDGFFSPATMAIASDFTGGSSGGPWVVGSSPTALSVTAYYYTADPGYLYGPYFGSAAQAVYRSVGGSASGSGSSPVAGYLRIVSVRHHPRARSATVRVRVSGAGELGLRGRRVARASRGTARAGTFKLAVHPTGVARRQLRKRGWTRVWIRVSFRADGGGLYAKRRFVTLLAA